MTSSFLQPPVSNDQIARMTETVSLAFANDPTWSPIVESRASDAQVALRYWDFFVRSGQRFPWTGSAEGQAAVSIWIPAGESELTPEEEARFPALAAELFGEETAEQLVEVTDRFEAATPDRDDFFYLSLLATHPARRGEGLGMNLLRANLEQLDELGVPTYLESSNPVNDARYASVGYERHGTIVLPSGLEIATMWRDPR